MVAWARVCSLTMKDSYRLWGSTLVEELVFLRIIPNDEKVSDGEELKSVFCYGENRRQFAGRFS